MNKVLVTGLALGTDAGLCNACNFDFEWLIAYPSVLIWADKIIVSQTIWDTISNLRCPGGSGELAKSLKLVFEAARSEGIVEVTKPADIITPALRKDISTQVRQDRTLLAKLFPETISLGRGNKIPGEIFVEGSEYCAPYVASIYAAFILARAYDAHCLFNKQALDYCKYKFGLTHFPKEGEIGCIQSFQAVFEAYLPNIPLFAGFIFSEKSKCSICVNEKNCRDTYLSTIEANLKEIFSWRDYDEIHQLKAVVSAIVRKREEGGGILNPNDVIGEFRNEQNKIRKRIKLVFPRVKRWSNITTMLSIPVVVAGVVTTNPLITVSGIGLGGLAKFAKELVDLLSNKYSWIGFVSKDAKLHQ